VFGFIRCVLGMATTMLLQIQLPENVGAWLAVPKT
jgi:hypothetical protein